MVSALHAEARLEGVLVTADASGFTTKGSPITTTSDTSVRRPATRVYLQTVHHKADAALPIFRKHFSPIQVGGNQSSGDLGVDRDDRGDNIAAKNATYCELTAMYWAWKNIDADFYGLMHYRRMFSARGSSMAHKLHMLHQWYRALRDIVQYDEIGHLWPSSRIVRDPATLELECRALEAFLGRDPAPWDVVLPSAVVSRQLSMSRQYALCNCQSDYMIMTNCVRELFPDMTDALTAASSGRSFRLYNMFVMRRSVFQDYAGRLFELLAEVEKRVDLTHRDAYQRRAFGFLAERFLNIYFRYTATKQRLRIVDLPTVFVDLG